MREENYMRELVRMVEEKTGWGSSETWTNYNFSLLSDDLKKETGKRISDSTLKRIFGKKRTRSAIYTPHIYTRNLLAQYVGYENWDELRKFQDKHPLRKINPARKRNRTKSSTGYLFLAILLPIITLSSVFLFSRGWTPVNPIRNLELKDSLGKVPFTAVFNYDLRESRDTILIDFGNNEIYFLSPKRNMITQFYPGIGYPEIEVRKNEQILARKNVHLISDTWQAGYSPSDSVHAYRPFEDQNIMYSPDRLYIPREVLSKSLPSGESDVFIEYRYFDKFNVQIDELQLSTRLKNSAGEGGKRCYDAEIILKGQNSDFVVRFLEPGCFRYVRFNVGEKRYFGRFHDLSMFARDISDWRNIRININQGKAHVYFEDELIRTEEYQEKMGELKGIIYRFYGNGSVDYVRMESEGNIILEDDFMKS